MLTNPVGDAVDAGLARLPGGPESEVIEEITQSKKLEQVLRQKTAVLTEEDRRMDLLLATVGHELRNPLAALDLELRLLQDGVEDVETIHARMGSHLQRLASFANDLLEMSRITYSKLELRKVPTDLVAVVRSAAEGAASDIREKKQKLVLCLPECLYVGGDPARLAQVVSNLIANASRYTPERGQIEVRGQREHDQVVIAVRDTGLGLRPEQLESVFERFVQDGPTKGGVGIGLALVKGLVELHGGTVSVQSDGPGRGCLFTVRMPVGEVGKTPPEAKRRSIRRLSRSVRVLIVDDHGDYADSLALLLSRMGAETLCAYSGADGIEKARMWNAEVMLVDLGLPDMMGYEVAQSIRSDPRGKGVLLIAVTGFSDGRSGQLAQCAGFDDRLVKPIDAERMHELLEQGPASLDHRLEGVLRPA